MIENTQVRIPAVAGIFYPAGAENLRLEVDRHLRAARPFTGRPVRAVIAPHAGYIYSGPVAGSAFRSLEGRTDIRRVVIAGPSHRLAFRGLALPTHRAFQTPLGNIPVDVDGVMETLQLPGCVQRNDAHAQEHSIEIMLPFVQVVLPNASIVPVVVGDSSPADLERLWGHFAGAPDTLALISTDLSHYHAYEVARRLDAATSQAIEAMDAGRIGAGDACGHIPLRGLLLAAPHLGWRAHKLDLRNSGDTVGGRDRVVGYGAYAFA